MQNLREALRLIGESEGLAVLRRSSVYETEPVGEVLDQPDFYNAVVELDCDLEPLALLDRCKAIEAQLGRDLAGPRHGPRPIDIDLLSVGDLQLSTDRLTLPHPQATSRRFVLEPLLEFDPVPTLPGVADLSAARSAIGNAERVSKVASL